MRCGSCGHPVDSPSAQYCSQCGKPFKERVGREPLNVRTKEETKQEFLRIANHLTHGRQCEAMELMVDFVSGIVNGRANPEAIKELMVKLRKASHVYWAEKMNVGYALTKAGLVEEEASHEERESK